MFDSRILSDMLSRRPHTMGPESLRGNPESPLYQGSPAGVLNNSLVQGESWSGLLGRLRGARLKHRLGGRPKNIQPKANNPTVGPAQQIENSAGGSVSPQSAVIPGGILRGMRNIF